MSYLSVKVRDYVAQRGVTAIDLEKRANVPATTIHNILRDSHPRPERLGQLLRVLPPAIAGEWLIAYLRDDVPAEWATRVEILVDTAGLPIDRLAESAAIYGAASIYGPAATARAQERLQTALESDPELGEWLVKTVNLILGPDEK
jgi:hypothetical protein